METKILEVRDEGTFIPVLCVDMNPRLDARVEPSASQRIQAYYMRRCGYPCDRRPNIAITNLNMDGGPAWNDPDGWGTRTMSVAHNFILEHWSTLRDGDVVDVQFVLGKTKQPKVSERLTERGDALG